MAHPSGFSYADIVAKLFKETAAITSLAEGAPGRSWKAWQKPPASNEFDDLIATLIQRRKKPTMRSRVDLEESGIPCPYYAARFYALMAIDKANHDMEAYDSKRAEKLERQKGAYAELIRAARLIQEGTERKLYGPTDALPFGDSYWEGPQRLTVPVKEIYDAGKAALEAATTSIERAEAWIDHLDREIARIAPDSGRPDVWKTSYATTMGNLWRLLTGEFPPYDSPLFGDFLTAPTNVIGATQAGWGQMKTLRNRFNAAGPGRGFDRGADTGLSLLRLDKVESRGEEVARFVRMAANKGEPIAAAILHLLDMTDEPRATVLREAYLRGLMIRHNVFTPTLSVQLGWLKTASDSVLRKAFADTLAMAKAGDGCAAAVIEMARYESGNPEAARIAQGLDWPSTYGGLSRANLMYDLFGRALRGDELSCAVLPLLFAYDPICADALPAVNLRIRLSQAPEDAELRAIMMKNARNAEKYHKRQARPVSDKPLGYRTEVLKP